MAARAPHGLKGKPHRPEASGYRLQRVAGAVALSPRTGRVLESILSSISSSGKLDLSTCEVARMDKM